MTQHFDMSIDGTIVAEEIEAMFMANNRYYASFNIWGLEADEVYELSGFTFSAFKVK